MCDKKPYRSKRHAREAVRTMGNSVRTYMCPDCASWHTTKQRYDGPSAKQERQERRKRRTLE